MPFQVANPKEGVMSMTIKCPKCSNTIEVESEWAGQKAECPYCQARFIIPEECKSSLAKPDNNVVRRPKMLWAGLICLYALLGMSIAENLFADKVSMGAIGIGCLMLWGVYRIQQGSKKARLSVTIMFCILTLPFLVMLKFRGLFPVLIFIVPVIFLWLPQCNAWFKEQQRIKELYGIK